MPELPIFLKNLEPIAKHRLLVLLSLKIGDPNWIDDNLWKKSDVILIVPSVTWA
jgi:hypothetical protein